MAGKRKRGEGTVRLRKDGRWEGRVVVGYDEAGNPKTKNVLAKTKKELSLIHILPAAVTTPSTSPPGRVWS